MRDQTWLGRHIPIDRQPPRKPLAVGASADLTGRSATAAPLQGIKETMSAVARTALTAGPKAQSDLSHTGKADVGQFAAHVTARFEPLHHFVGWRSQHLERLLQVSRGPARIL